MYSILLDGFSFNGDMPTLRFRTNTYDPNIYGGKTIYIAFFIRSNGAVSDRSGQSITAKSSRNSSGSFANSTYVTDIPVTVNWYNASNPYTTMGKSTSAQVCFHFTLPDNSRAWQVDLDNLFTASSTVTNVEVVFPTLYIANWGSSTAAQLGNILTACNTIAANTSNTYNTLTLALTVLNNLYTELVDIGTTADDIYTIIGNVSNQLSTVISNQSTANTYLLNIWNQLIQEYTRLGTINTNIETGNGILTDISNYASLIYALLDTALEDESQELTDSATQAMNQVQMQADTESYWLSRNQTAYDELNIANYRFDGEPLKGIQVAANIFYRLWVSLGTYQIVITFGLMFAVALVLIGRIARTSRKSGGNSD